MVGLSLFNGMGCFEIALIELGIDCEVMYTSEVDKFALQQTRLNFPRNIELGDVRNIDVSKLDRIDFLAGGSPCQSFSFAGKRKGMATKCDVEIYNLEKYLELKEQGFEFEGQSYLFWEYMRILRESKPKYFLLENVVMGEKWENILSGAIGVKPIMINSALVSAQNRKRLYWVGQIRERIYYSENYCYLCGNLKNQQDENRGIQEEAQRKRASKILGVAQIRYCNMQSVRKNISEDRPERHNKNLFGGVSINQQEKQRQESGCCIENRIQQEVLQREQAGIIKVPTGLSKNWYRKRNYEKGRLKKDDSKERKVQSLQGIESATEQKDFRNNKYFESKTDMCCVQCGKELDHRPRYSFVEGWDKYDRKSPSSLSKMQFDEIKQNNGRIFDIIPVGVQGIDSIFGETINPIPQPKDMGILLKDILESEVDEKYYLSDKMLNYFDSRAANLNNGKINVRDEQGKATTITASCKSVDISDNFVLDTKLKPKENQTKANCFTAGGNSGGLHSDMDLICVAMRGRNPDNPSDRTTGSKTEQRLEQNLSWKTNCLTSVQKDNLIAIGCDFRTDEGIRLRKNGKSGTLAARARNDESCGQLVQKNIICHNTMPRSSTTGKGGTGHLSRNDGKTYCLDTGQTNAIEIQTSRIRRLTPTECSRLQTIPDWYKWESHNGYKCSDTQRYKMLGNGWTIEVIKHILSFIKNK